MSKLKIESTYTKPGTLCEPSTLPEIQQVITINVKDLSGLVQREVDAYIASLPFAGCDFITVQKAADLLKVYEDTVRVYIRNGQLSAIKLGKDYRIRIVDFQNFIQNKMTKVISMKLNPKHKKVC